MFHILSEEIAVIQRVDEKFANYSLLLFNNTKERTLFFIIYLKLQKTLAASLNIGTQNQDCQISTLRKRNQIMVVFQKDGHLEMTRTVGYFGTHLASKAEGIGLSLNSSETVITSEQISVCP